MHASRLSLCVVSALGVIASPATSQGNWTFRSSPINPKASSPASTDPTTKYHLLIKPPAGGTPIMPREATKKAPIVHGRWRPIPPSSLILVRREAQ